MSDHLNKLRAQCAMHRIGTNVLADSLRALLADYDAVVAERDALRAKLSQDPPQPVGEREQIAEVRARVEALEKRFEPLPTITLSQAMRLANVADLREVLRPTCSEGDAC